MTEPADAGIAAVAALADPLRCRLYRFVTSQDEPVSRDAAAEAAGITRSAAAFHLDRLVDDGLLDAEFRRLTGRTGPGAGRPAKLYRRAGIEIAVTLPARRYDLAAGLLAAAVAEATDTGAPVAMTLEDVARRRGAALAASVASGPGGPVAAAEAADALAAEGYEPRVVGEEIVLANCPFRGLAATYPGVVCPANLAMLQGFADHLRAATASAATMPARGGCCVRLRVGGLNQIPPPGMLAP